MKDGLRSDRPIVRPAAAVRTERDDALACGLYIHIPLCASRCIYCDFYSTTQRDVASRLVDAILSEADRRLSTEGWQQRLSDRPLRTVYIGGGTPSQLPPPELVRMVCGLQDRVDMSLVEEFTIEANPEDVTTTWCATTLAPLPLRHDTLRVSLGVQSLNDEELHLLRRRHDSRRPAEAIRSLRNAGVGNVSIDLMYGLPTQTMSTWEATITDAVALRPDHVSAYALSIEEGTELARRVVTGELKVATDDETVAMASLLRARLHDSGFEQYEISNYARHGRRSLHNTGYWTGTPYLGLGPGAHSYDGLRTRSWNASSLMDYINGRYERSEETLTNVDIYNEAIMLGLRTSDGVSIDDVKQKRQLADGQRGVDIMLDTVAHLTERGWMASAHGRIALTTDGIDMADAAIRELFVL